MTLPLTSTPAVLGVLAACVAASEYLCATTRLARLGSSLLVIVITAVVANAGLIPTYDAEEPLALYDVLLGDVAWAAVFWLLLGVNLRDCLAAGRPMLFAFAAGALGTVLGVVCGMAVVGGASAFGELYRGLGGMFVGTYVGGSLNFTALATEYEMFREPGLVAGASAVDSGATTLWMAASLALPRLLRPLWPANASQAAEVPADAKDASSSNLDRESVAPGDLALCMTLAVGAILLSRWLTGVLAGAGVRLPGILILTTLALLAAQTPLAKRLTGARVLGMLGVQFFLAAIGALCDVQALRALGGLGVDLVLFVAVLITVHGVVSFGAARLLRIPPDVAAVASQANIGGGSTALALARSLGRGDLVLPALLVGSLGTAVGTYLGLVTAAYLI